jgi:hypothetical protein
MTALDCGTDQNVGISARLQATRSTWSTGRALLATLSGAGTLLVGNGDRRAQAACINGAGDIATTEMAVSEDLLSVWQERCRCLPP